MARYCTRPDLSGERECRWGVVDNEGRCGMHSDLDNAPEVMSKVLWLLNWARHGGVGDNGERASVRFEFEGGWDVEADGVDPQGHASVSGKATLRETLEEVIERLTEHPERQREQEMAYVALTIASHTDLDKEQAMAMLSEHWNR